MVRLLFIAVLSTFLKLTFKCVKPFYAMIDSLSEEELFKPHMRKWADEATKTAVWEVYKFIHVNTVAPFGTFRTKIRKWKKIAL